jgi:hypothetical protein
LRLLIALFALMLAIALATLWFWRRSTGPSPCESREVAHSSSPDGRARVDVFEVRCPGAISTHVALRSQSEPAQARGDVFVALGKAPVQVLWNGDSELVIESPAGRVLLEETRWRDVSVRVRRLP